MYPLAGGLIYRQYCIRIRPCFTVYPTSRPSADIIPFPNKDSAVAVAAVPGFSFGIDFILFGS